MKKRNDRSRLNNGNAIVVLFYNLTSAFNGTVAIRCCWRHSIDRYPTASFIDIGNIDIFDFGTCERTAELSHSRLPLFLANDRQPFDVAIMLPVKLNVFPKRTGRPPMEVPHDN